MSLGQGYSDWQRQAQVSGPPFVDLGSTVFAASTDFGPFYTGNWDACQHFWNLSNDKVARLTLTWYEDQAATIQLGQAHWTVGGFGQLGVCFVVDTCMNLGPWVKVNVSPKAADTVTLAQLRLAPRNGTSRQGLAPDSTLVGFGQATSIAGGATTTFRANNVTGGVGTLFVGSDTDAWDATLQAASLDGTFQPVAGMAPVPKQLGLSIPITIPRKQLRISIHNQDGVAHTFNYLVAVQT